MNVGDRMTIPFAKGTKEGTVVRVCDKAVWLRVDFPRHPGKLIRRKLGLVQNTGARKKGRRSK